MLSETSDHCEFESEMIQPAPQCLVKKMLVESGTLKIAKTALKVRNN